MTGKKTNKTGPRFCDSGRTRICLRDVVQISTVFRYYVRSEFRCPHSYRPDYYIPGVYILTRNFYVLAFRLSSFRGVKIRAPYIKLLPSLSAVYNIRARWNPVRTRSRISRFPNLTRPVRLNRPVECTILFTRDGFGRGTSYIYIYDKSRSVYPVVVSVNILLLWLLSS